MLCYGIVCSIFFFSSNLDTASNSLYINTWDLIWWNGLFFLFHLPFSFPFFFLRKFTHLSSITFFLFVKVKFQSQIYDFFISFTSCSTFLFSVNFSRELRNHHHQLSPLHVRNKIPLILVFVVVRRFSAIAIVLCHESRVTNSNKYLPSFNPYSSFHIFLFVFWFLFPKISLKHKTLTFFLSFSVQFGSQFMKSPPLIDSSLCSQQNSFVFCHY